MTNIFVYGTLQNTEIVRALTGKSFKQIPCTLSDYAVLSVKGEHFPGMIRSAGSKAQGYILYDVDKKALECIDTWEGAQYTPTQIQASVDGTVVEAQTYIWLDKTKLEGAWDNETYRTTHMHECIEKCIPKEFAVKVLET